MNKTLQHDGLARSYTLYIPPSYTGSEAWPLVFDLHGAGGDGSWNFFSRHELPAVVPVPGDYNQNGSVDAADYVVWRRGLGTTYTQAHYDVWRANFGQTVGSGAAIPSAEPMSIAVPEPATLTLLVMAIIVYCPRRRSILAFG